jgi:DNA topoisomerase-1
MLKLGKKPDGTKFTAEDLTTVDLEAVKKMIETQIPSAFVKKTKTVKKTTTKAAKKKK